jgi:cytosine/adenosine deaminase-related metal-dependent hydrolase
MYAMLAEHERQGKGARINAYLDVIARANKTILREVLKMGFAATLAEVMEEAGLTQQWEERGEARGETRGTYKVAQNALRAGSSEEFVRQITGLDVNTIRSLR